MEQNNSTKKQLTDQRKLQYLCWIAVVFFFADISPLLAGSRLFAAPVSVGVRYFQQASKVDVSGTVTDSKGEALVGVAVKVKTTTQGTLTDANGNFKITVNAGETLVFSFIGSDSKEVLITPTTTVLKITLTETYSVLDAVVIVGFGEQKKASVVGAIKSVEGKELLRVGGVNTVSEALQGLAPGVTAVNSTGKPGSDAADLFIRGKSSFNNTEPFTLVDGVERPINQIDPNEIETISILKDASATAVYGVRGANGVILITTKRGKSGKPKFNFTSNFGMKKLTTKPVYSDYITTQRMYNEAAANSGDWGQIIPESVIRAWEQNIQNANPYNDYFPQIDWFDELIGTGYQQSYNLNASGGSDFMKYFVSVGYLNDGDVFKTKANDQYDPKFSFERYNWRSNFDFNLTKTTTFSVNFSGNYRYRNQPGYRIDGGGEDGFGQPQFFQRIYTAPRNLFPIKYSDGVWGDSQIGDVNMLMNLNEGGQRIYKYYEGFYDAILDQKLDFITKGLSAKGKISFTSNSDYLSNILRGGIGGGFANINIIRYYRQYDLSRPLDGNYPIINEGGLGLRWPTPETQEGPVSANYDNFSSYGRRLYYELSLAYKREFGKHTVSGLALMNRQTTVEHDGTNSNITVQFPTYREDWVGRVTYAFADKYLTEFNASYTGSEKFGPGKRFGFFPSFSLGWVLTEESFIKDHISSHTLNLLKIRYSQGKVGNDKGAPRFTYIQQYNSGASNTVRFGLDRVNNAGVLYTEGTLPNVDATWETSIKQNIGIEIGMLDKLRATVDFFKEDRSGILFQRRTIPRSLGIESPTQNTGRTKNRGFEIELNWTEKIGSDFTYYIKPNFSTSQNRVVFKDDPVNAPDYLKDEGKPIDYQRRYQFIGYYGSLDDIYNYASPIVGTPQGQLIPGDAMYLDYNGDGVTDISDRIPQQESTVPFTTYGLTLGFTYKNWSFNTLFYGVSDVYKEIPALLLWDFNSGYLNGQSNITDRWTPETAATASKPVLRVSGTSHSQQSSTYSYVNASYVRMKNAELGYTLPTQTIKRIGLSSASLYINASNLFTITKLTKLIDPETEDAGVYPIVRRYNIGLRVSF